MPSIKSEDYALDSVRTSGDPLSTDDDPQLVSHAIFDEKATRRLLRKIDFTLIPFLSLLYL
jgi:hypothetical protein